MDCGRSGRSYSILLAIRVSGSFLNSGCMITAVHIYLELDNDFDFVNDNVRALLCTEITPIQQAI